ncbi:uncharacterized protein FOMMEDRAFT_157247 [Fomitiporia mediterranea MF3/22]|uniref:uncharacterized protein n=1 Tax=Fomitiporia mediterranea (strain MF3/22) TaxID=694068 RepID=UPI000440744C|nr:uncharacterized protein FOMMEDRAFT_157247 [Fomitiporia mediterranea MF3/22]EJD02058.1 hypothetical protein FOMMEDRAFT_157247 [Fomitiporia mediterranea MF3/22]
MPVPKTSHNQAAAEEEDLIDTGGWSPGSNYSLSSDTPKGKHVKKLVDTTEDDINVAVLTQQPEAESQACRDIAQKMCTIVVARKVTMVQMQDEMKTLQDSTD